MHRFITMLLLLGMCFIFAPTTVGAAAFPQKPIQVIVSWPPGGTDTTIRIFSDAVRDLLPQPLVVSNVTGAGGMNGMTQAVRARPDGYTMFWEHPANLAASPYALNADFRWTDFDIICAAAMSDTALVVPSSSPFKTAKEAFDYIKANPGKVRWTAAINATSHFHFLDIQEKAGGKLDVILVPGAGEQTRIVALLGGQSDITTISYAGIDAYVRSGDLRVLAMLNPERSPFAPDVPTMREEGFDVIYDFLYTALVPKGTPESVQKILADAFEKAVADPAVEERLRTASAIPIFLNREEATKRWAVEAAKYERLIDNLRRSTK